MKIRLIKPLVQSGRVIPSGVILSNAPTSFMRKLVAQGHAEMIDGALPPDGLSTGVFTEDILAPVQQAQAVHVAVATAQKEKQTPNKPTRKKVMPHG